MNNNENVFLIDLDKYGTCIEALEYGVDNKNVCLIYTTYNENTGKAERIISFANENDKPEYDDINFIDGSSVPKTLRFTDYSFNLENVLKNNPLKEYKSENITIYDIHNVDPKQVDGDLFHITIPLKNGSNEIEIWANKDEDIIVDKNIDTIIKAEYGVSKSEYKIFDNMVYIMDLENMTVTLINESGDCTVFRDITAPTNDINEFILNSCKSVEIKDKIFKYEFNEFGIVSKVIDKENKLYSIYFEDTYDKPFYDGTVKIISNIYPSTVHLNINTYNRGEYLKLFTVDYAKVNKDNKITYFDKYVYKVDNPEVLLDTIRKVDNSINGK